MIKTGIPDAPQRKADFAGHYILVEGSCGTGCEGLNVMDARNGEVYNFKHTISECGASDVQRVRYLLTSNLLILHGELDDKEKTYGTYYYLFKANRFIRLRYIRSKPLPVP